MYRFRAPVGGVVVALLALVCVAGCPEGAAKLSDLSQLSDLLSPVAGESRDAATAAMAERAATAAESASSAASVAAVPSPTGTLQGAVPAVSVVAEPAADVAMKDEVTFQALRAPVEPDALADASAAVEPIDAAADVAVAELVDALAVPLEAIVAEVTDGDGPAAALPFGHGRLAGHWHPDDPNANNEFGVGAFLGRWMTHDGASIGVVVGRYQPLRPSSLPPGLARGGIFVARCVDANGSLIGHLRGRYGNGPERPGVFFGRWRDADERLVGVVKGHWRSDPNVPGGHFAGRWATFDLCEEVASLPAMDIAADDFGGLAPVDELAPVDLLGDAAYESSATLAEEPDLVYAEPTCLDPALPRGFYRGYYMPVNSTDPNQPYAGRWHARWRNGAGTLIGHLIGVYVPIAPEPPARSDAGPLVLGRFYAKYVDVNGQFRGFVRGHYGISERGLGVMRGHYTDADGNQIGDVIGRWRHAPNRPGGPVFGFWWGLETGGDDEEL